MDQAKLVTAIKLPAPPPPSGDVDFLLQSEGAVMINNDKTLYALPETTTPEQAQQVLDNVNMYYPEEE